MPPRVPSGSPSMWSAWARSGGTRYTGARRRDGRIADREAGDLARCRQVLLEQRRRDLQDVGDVVEPVRLIVGRQEARWRRCRARADRGRRWRIRSGSGGAAATGPGWVSRAPRDRSWFRGTRRATRWSAWSGRGAPSGGIIPPRSLRTTFSQVSAPSGTRSRSHLVERQTGGLDPLVVAGDAVTSDQRARRAER